MKIFVFGSNLAGRHGKGDALIARREWGAQYGVGRGLTGRAYALPTKTGDLEPRTLDEIRDEVDRFKRFALQHPEVTFLVARVGCGLAGYTDAQIAPMFADAPVNCELPKGWR